jgi:xylulokinase
MFESTGIAPGQIQGIGVDGQSGAAIVLNGDGEPLRHAIIWLDGRSADQCRQLVNDVGEERLFAVSGNPMAPSYITSKISWLREHEPERYGKTAALLQCNSYIVYKLTGRLTQDVSQGNGLHAFNIYTKSWDFELSRELGIAPEWLPDIYECSDVVGEVTPEAAVLTGLAAGTPVVAGGLDAACAALGAGAVSPGEVQEQGGQAGGMSIVMGQPVAHPKLILSCHVVKDRWILQGGTVGGGSLNWLRREFAGEDDADFFQFANAGAAKINAGSDGLLFLPYMAGERSPIWDPQAKGVFIGLSYEKTKAHMVRAIMEGCAMALRHNLLTAEESGVPIHVLHSTGGAANSSLWTQIKADVTGKVIKNALSDCSTTLGAAILAGVGTGVYRVFEEAKARTVRLDSEYQPNPAVGLLYDRQLELYLECYDRLKDLFPRLGR